jgi:hypothetical protein
MGSPRFARETDSARRLETAASRAETIAQFVPVGARVAELSAHGASLRRHLPYGCTLQSGPIDAGFVAEVAAKAEIIVLLDALGSLTQAETLLGAIARAARPAVIHFHAGEAFAATDSGGAPDFHGLIGLIDRFGLRIEASFTGDDGETILRLAVARKVAPLAPCSVAVLSGGMTFAERLGGQMIAALMPGEADVHHVNFGDLGAARDSYDLVILGTGQGLFHPLFADEVFDVVKRGRAAIGIFGTIHRDLLPRAAFDRLLGSLDVWFARHRDDVMLYGRGRDNVSYLGDWLIEQFPLGQAREGELLAIGEGALSDLPLDRAIQAIQRHRAVFARAAAPLLCALTTADSVAYADEDPDGPSGEFRSLLGDIFGRANPPSEFFQVDRDAVMRYRAAVHRNVSRMRARIDAILRGGPLAAAA